MLNFGDLWFTVAKRIKDFDQGGAVAKELVNRAAREIALKAYWPFLTDERQFISRKNLFCCLIFGPVFISI